ncbi:GspH/FimT family pseudopilin [Teredinibacter sp. KSP-S5-2]|uniref:GspH/FimT family pseudopilin n=1 Tax=Teredinibacter sp. KSP-S5-2 TaxID=3034506 RepID=UPI00293473C8|nr:GspH/FimT family pseudopilin [Teredinibacter sp. KSP-S5-2]WNO09866.1 GspH/FimT family pseudopilin [Teredinibacter sp. KSP-S5-2]
MYSRDQGFTLIDLLIAISILAILFGMAIPQFSVIQAKAEAKSTTSAIRRSLAFGRQKAVVEQKHITVCGADGNLRCEKNNPQNIIVFDDKNNDRQYTNDEILYSNLALTYSGTLKLRASLGRSYIEFRSNGSAKQAGSFEYCKPGIPTASRRVTISLPGRPYIGRDFDNDGVVEDAKGKPIKC